MIQRKIGDIFVELDAERGDYVASVAAVAMDDGRPRQAFGTDAGHAVTNLIEAVMRERGPTPIALAAKVEEARELAWALWGAILLGGRHANDPDPREHFEAWRVDGWKPKSERESDGIRKKKEEEDRG